MDEHDIEGLIKKVDARTTRIEQILPTLATKNDLQGFATKDDLQGFATKDDLQRFATKDDLQRFATKDDLQGFATKDDLQGFATKEDLKAHPTREEVRLDIKEEGERTRRHFDVVAERFEANVKVLAEGHEALGERITKLGQDINSVLTNHEGRIARAEAGTSKRR